MKSLILTVIDVGTNSIMGLVGKKDLKSGQIEILAKNEQPCFGVRSGKVVRPQKVAGVVIKLKNELSRESGLKLKEVITNINGDHLFSMTSQGLVSVSRADTKISKEDVERVLKAAKAVNMPSNKEIIAVLPKEFIIDGQGEIREPLGLEGIRLEAKVLLVCLFTPVLENLGRAFSEANMEMIDVLPSPLASARAVLSQEQKELGVAVLDIGAGTTSLAIFEKGDLVDFAVFPIGSANITNDIAIGLRTEIKTAEDIKREFAVLEAGLARQRGLIRAKTKSNRKQALERIEIPDKELVFTKKFLSDIVQARVSEIFIESEKALKKILKENQLPSGIVLTGGGANLPGIVQFAKEKFNLPCQIGRIREIAGLDDNRFSICAGLLLSGFDPESRQLARSGRKSAAGLAGRLKQAFKAFLP